MILITHKISSLCLILSVTLCSLLIGDVRAQVTIESEDLLVKPIDEIEIIGNKVTQVEIILREMKIRPGTIASEEMLRTDLLRVRGLDLFSRVEFFLISRREKRILKIEVTEEWYIFPLPYWNLSDDDPPELTYGFRYLQENFRGRAERLQASLWDGADRGFRFSHTTPWMKGTPSLTRAIDMYQSTQESRNLAVKDLGLESRHTGVQIRFGKRWSVELSSQIGAHFRLVQADNPLQLATGGDLDRILETIIMTLWDGRDLRQLPRRGLYINSGLVQGWHLNTNQRYQRFLLDLSTYIPYKIASICSRIQWHPGWGNIPPYDWIIVEETSPIRSSRLSDEGKSFLLITTEARFDLHPLHYFTWHGAPFFKPYFRNLKYGLAAELFLDVGDAYDGGDTLKMSSLMWGFGAGLLLRLPYVDVVRLESSWNPEYSLADARFSWKIGVSF